MSISGKSTASTGAIKRTNKASDLWYIYDSKVVDYFRPESDICTCQRKRQHKENGGQDHESN